MTLSGLGGPKSPVPSWPMFPLPQPTLPSLLCVSRVALASPTLVIWFPRAHEPAGVRRSLVPLTRLAAVPSPSSRPGPRPVAMMLPASPDVHHKGFVRPRTSWGPPVCLWLTSSSSPSWPRWLLPML